MKPDAEHPTLPWRLARAGRLLREDPGALLRKAWHRTLLRMDLPLDPFWTASVGGARIRLDLRDDTQRAMFAERYESPEVGFLREALHPGETLIDVGANIGYLSAVALGQVGPAGQVHAFEPAPVYFERLRSLSAINPRHRFRALNAAVGETEGTLLLQLSNNGNIGWNTLVDGLMPETQIREKVRVPVRPLDDYIREMRIPRVHLVKIDSEGFEFPVLKGMRTCLEDHRPSVLCEVAPAAYPILGLHLGGLGRFLKEVGYRAKTLSRQPLDLEGLESTTNVLFLPEEGI